MSTIKFGLSTDFDCGYLENKTERLLVYIDEQPLTPLLYSALQNQGFRRSEGYVYRPHCQHCNACQSIRIPTHRFVPTRSQKRIQNRGKRFNVKLSRSDSPSFYPLYKTYIENIHKNGVMDPPDEKQLCSFSECEWMDRIFIELYDGELLIAVAICDETPDSLSAVYTFYHPAYAKFSLGTFMILQQINLANQLDKPWLYLGYFIKNCEKMNYKTKFKPYQILKDGVWHSDD